MDRTIVVIDADSIPYIAASSKKYDTTSAVDWIVNKILSDTFASQYIMVESSSYNLRKAENPDYKANRVGLTKPDEYDIALAYLRSNYRPVTVNGLEADDVCCVLHQRYNCTLAGIDKDLLQSPGLHYNYRTFTFTNVSQFGDLYILHGKVFSSGKRKLYMQLLEGDRSDNIPGIPGIGPKKAYNLLKDCKSEQELTEVVIGEYMRYYGKAQAIQRYVLNFKMLLMPLNSPDVPDFVPVPITGHPEYNVLDDDEQKDEVLSLPF